MAHTCVVFVNSFDYDRDVLSNEIHSGPLYLASFLKAKFGEEVDVRFIDLKIEVEKRAVVPLPLPGSWGRFLSALELIVNKKLGGFSGHVIFGLSCLTSKQYAGTILTAIALRHLLPGATIVVGGYHASSAIADFLPYGTLFDYIVLNEGEQVLADLVSRPPESKQDRVGVTPRVIRSTPISDLDMLPLLDIRLFADYLREYPSLSINLSRGCPFSCAFCLEHDVTSKSWRAYAPSRAIEEIKNMVKTGREYGISKFGFYDPNFGHNRVWRGKVLGLMIQENFGVEFWSETRFDTLPRSDLELYKRAQLYMMFGLETGSPIMLKIMKKTGNPRNYLEYFKNLMQWCEELNYPSVVNLLFNHPGETQSTMYESQQYLLDIFSINPNVIDNSMLYRHYPGSSVANNAGLFGEKYGARFFGSTWWHLLTHQRKASMLNQASHQLPAQLAQETFLEYEISRLELILDHAGKGNILDLPKVFQLKGSLDNARKALHEVQCDKIFFGTSVPQVPAHLWGEFPAVVGEASQVLEDPIIVHP